MGTSRKEELQRLRAIADQLEPGSEVLLAQRPHPELGVRRIVLDEQNLHAAAIPVALLALGGA